MIPNIGFASYLFIDHPPDSWCKWHCCLYDCSLAPVIFTTVPVRFTR